MIFVPTGSIWGSLASTLLLTTFVYIPLGIIAGAMIQRLSYHNYLAVFHCPHSWWNTAIKFPVPLMLVYYVLYTQSCGNDGKSTLLWIVCYMLNIFGITSGAVVGSSFQPIGITGGIACGKSTVSNLLLQKQNFIIIDLDKIGHDVLDPTKSGHHTAYYDLVRTFGDKILCPPPKGTPTTDTLSSFRPINRDELGKIAFSCPSSRRQLNAMTHPRIFKITLEQIFLLTLLHPGSVVAVDIPLLFEGGFLLRVLFGYVIVVASHAPTQILRLGKRNPGWSEEQVKGRIESQWPLAKKVAKADVVLWNEGDLRELEEDVNRLGRDVYDRVVGKGVRFWMVIPTVALGMLLCEIFVVKRCYYS